MVRYCDLRKIVAQRSVGVATTAATSRPRGVWTRTVQLASAGLRRLRERRELIPADWHLAGYNTKPIWRRDPDDPGLGAALPLSQRAEPVFIVSGSVRVSTKRQSAPVLQSLRSLKSAADCRKIREKCRGPAIGFRALAAGRAPDGGRCFPPASRPVRGPGSRPAPWLALRCRRCGRFPADSVARRSRWRRTAAR